MVMQEQQVQEEKDPTAGRGQPRSEGDSIAAAGSNAPSASTAAPELASASAGGGPAPGDGDGTAQAGGGGDGENIPPADPKPDPLKDVTRTVALADVMKPIAAATEDLHSKAPDKAKARDAITKAYAKAYPELLAKYHAADASFLRTAIDMKVALEDWIKRLLKKIDPKGAVAAALAERAQVRSGLNATMGRYERQRADAQARTKWWADRFADWSSPDARIAALIVDPAKIDKLNADINNNLNADAAILSFWFEVAPKHLQVRPKALDPELETEPELKKQITDLKKQITDLKNAIGPDTDIAKWLDPGVIRSDGSIYLIDPSNLETRRQVVLAHWKAVAEAQATAEADYKLSPDDAATLKQRWDKLKDDGWLKDLKSALGKPAA
jgi:hypothetical protein